MHSLQFSSLMWLRRLFDALLILWNRSLECYKNRTDVTNDDQKWEGQYLSVLVINHDVMGLDVSVHDSHTVAVVQGLRRQDFFFSGTQRIRYYWMNKWNKRPKYFTEEVPIVIQEISLTWPKRPSFSPTFQVQEQNEPHWASEMQFQTS